MGHNGIEYWIIESADVDGAALNVAFTGTVAEVRNEARTYHPGSTVTRHDRFTGTVNA